MNKKMKEVMSVKSGQSLPTSLKDLKKSIPKGGLLAKSLRGGFDLDRKPKFGKFDVEKLHEKMFKD